VTAGRKTLKEDIVEPVIFPNDPQFWYETQRILGHAAYGGSDTGEVLATAQQIVPGDYDSWHDQWLATAERISADAEASLVKGHLVTARDGFLRASTYYRSAEFFLHGRGEDARIARAYERQVESFRWAAALFDSPIEPVAIPYDDLSLNGYFYTAPGNGPRPTIVMHNGFDGSAEEMHFFGAAAALERGYNVLSFDGPGQPAARHQHGLVFRPDWEHVVWQMLDWVLKQPEVDPARVALMGVSMGGYLAVRAAAFEQRLAACIAIDGLYDLGEASVEHIPLPRAVAEDLLRADEAPDLDAEIERLMAVNPTARWALSHGQWAMGVDSPRRFLASYLDYTLAGGIAEQVRCPTAICEAEEDGFFDGQAREIYDHLVCPKRLFHFSSREGAGAHCHSGAQRLAFGRVYDWLDETLGYSQPLSIGGLLLEHPILAS
jgi:pimeloyl-ACP methyl ester carboxylesterase